jgi:hypothetical protein
VATTADINAGTIDGTVIGGTTPAAVTAASLVVNGNNYPSDGALSNRNLIINGSVIVNQRNEDTAITSGWACDRWNAADNQNGITRQRNGGDYTRPDGFQNYLRYIVTTAKTKGAGDYAVTYQPIEAYNIQPLKWGTAAAESATLSFVSRSNVTGTFGGSIQNHDGSMCYPFTYTISTADTWEKQVVVIDGPTSGTWNHDNGRGVVPTFGMGVGSTYSRPAGSWTTDYTFTATGAADITGTLNNYLAITGVQLEVGDTATPFEHRSYGQELALCQRYYETDNPLTPNAFGGNIRAQAYHPANGSGSALSRDGPFQPYKVDKRASATVTTYAYNGTTGAVSIVTGGGTDTNVQIRSTTSGFQLSSSTYRSLHVWFAWAADAEL